MNWFLKILVAGFVVGCSENPGDEPPTTCGAGQVRCGNVCADPQSDAANCGGCGISCGGGACVAGSCAAGTGGVGTGGAPPTGGVPTGGVSTGGGTGGACTNTRPTGTDWDSATCDQWATQTSECNNAWMVDNNYCNESCGRCSSAGTGGTSTGGTTTGGSGGIPDTCTESDLTLNNNQTGQHCGYTYEYWKDSGSGSLILKSDGFSVSWSGINNLLGRKGIRPGSASQIVTYDANYQPDGNSYLCVYGWTRNPLIEYYIVDSWGTWRPPGGTSMGTVTTDGGTYDIYQTQRVNQPSIDGQATFYQYWSVRTEKRTSGTITVGSHFSAWASKGMNMGSFYEVSMTVEGYQSSGTADVRMMMR